MLEQIKLLPLNDKKTLLAMLQSDIGLTVKVDIVVEKPSIFTLESRRCNDIALVKRHGRSVIYTELNEIL
jgi:hypothetical protein